MQYSTYIKIDNNTALYWKTCGVKTRYYVPINVKPVGEGGGYGQGAGMCGFVSVTQNFCQMPAGRA